MSSWLLWASTSVSSDQLTESEWTNNLTPSVFLTQFELISYQNALSDMSTVSQTIVLVWRLVRLSYPLKQPSVRLSDPRHTQFISDRGSQAKCSSLCCLQCKEYCIKAYRPLYCKTQSITYYALVSVAIALSCALLNQTPLNCPEIENHCDIDYIEMAPLT